MDKRQVEHLFRQCYKSMYATAYGLLYDEQEAKDVVSSIFVDLLGKDLLLKDETCEQYLLTVTRHRCLNIIRGKSNRQRIARQYAMDFREKEDNMEDEKLNLLSDFARTHLTKEEQTIFSLRFIDGLPYKDICSKLDISRIAVWKHIRHIVDILKSQFAV